VSAAIGSFAGRAIAASIALAAAVASAQSLVPAGTINAAIRRPEPVIVAQSDPAIASYAQMIQKRFFAKSRILSDVDATDDALRASDVVVYGDRKHAWLVRHAAELPFRWLDGAVEIDGRRFSGEHLRVICALRHPSDPTRRVLVYTAAKAEDVSGINGVFHGPTEWVVADGTRTLGAGSFESAPLAPAELQSDLDFLVATLRDVHPLTVDGLPPAVQRAADATRDLLRRPMTRGEEWRALAPVLVALRDGHSALSPPASSERLAMSFAWLAEGLVVTDDEGELKTGDRILTIAGNDERRLEALLGTVVPFENPGWLHVRGEDLLCDLGVLRALGLASGSPVTVRVERDGKELEAKVGTAVAGARPTNGAPWIRFDVDKEHDLAVLTLDRCALDSPFGEVLERFFRAVHDQKIGRVAVDLRENSGGDSRVTDEFLEYVDVDECACFGADVRLSKAVADKYPGQSSGVVRSKPGRHANPRHDDPPPYKGKIDVLVGPKTFSSGNWFALVVQDGKLGRVVGEPTGNAPSSCGDIVPFTLPKSALTFSLSHKRWIRPDPTRDPADSVVPDVIVKRTREHVRSGVDAVLDYLRREAPAGGASGK
jgi:C-terminal processing protease CtpA/Prc